MKNKIREMRQWTQHNGNVLHLYCRFLDVGLNKRMAICLAKSFGWFVQIVYI